jgi:hypothetical protein
MGLWIYDDLYILKPPSPLTITWCFVSGRKCKIYHAIKPTMFTTTKIDTYAMLASPP